MRILFGIVVIAFLAWTALTTVTEIQPGEMAVVRRFGKVVAQPGPGLYFGLPWGIDRVDKVPINKMRQVRVGYVAPAEDFLIEETIPDGQLLTGDHNLVNVQVELNYKVDEKELVQYVLQKNRVDVLLARATENAIAEWIAGRTVEVVLLDGKLLLGPYVIDEVRKRAEKYQLGIAVAQVSVDLQTPADVKDAFDAVARQKENNETAMIRAIEEANRRKQAMEAEIYQGMSYAQAYKTGQILEAKADAETFAKQAEQYHRMKQYNPYYLSGIWYDQMGQLYADMRKSGRIDLLDHYLGADGVTITQIPVLPKK